MLELFIPDDAVEHL